MINISDTVNPDANMKPEPVLVSDDEEITSPMCYPYFASRCHLFDEVSPSPTAGVSSSFPPRNAFPRKPTDRSEGFPIASKQLNFLM